MKYRWFSNVTPTVGIPAWAGNEVRHIFVCLLKKHCFLENKDANPNLKFSIGNFVIVSR